MIKISSDFINDFKGEFLNWYIKMISRCNPELISMGEYNSKHNKLCKDLYNKRNEIVLYTRDKMITFKNRIKLDYTQKEIDQATSKPKGSKTKTFCERVFDYQKFRKQMGFDFIHKAGLKSCPYCNTAYVFSLTKNNKASPDLDHFYPKSRHPYFATTLYNLIPACTFCNQRLKGDSPITHLYPYAEEFGKDARFNYRPSSSKKFDPYLKNTNLFDIIVKIDQTTKLAGIIKNHKELFKIDELYKFHKNRVSRIAEIKRYFSEKLPGELQKRFHDLFVNDSEVLKEVQKVYFDHLTQKGEILSKFHKDIIDQINQEFNKP